MRRLVLLACLVAPLAAEEVPPEADPLDRPDPSLHIEARGERFTYRTRDLDALMLVVRRYLGRAPAEDEERELRRIATEILVAREPLLPLIDALPDDLDPRVRDHLVLDLLAYRPQPGPEPSPIEPPAASSAASDAPPPVHVPPPTEAPPAPIASDAPSAPDDGATPPATTAPALPPPPAIDQVPLDDDLLRLPPMSLSRRLRDGGTAAVRLGLALQLPEDIDRDAISARMPLIQDACITAIHGLGEAELNPPDPIAIKGVITAAIAEAFPSFDGQVLVTELSTDQAP